MAYLKNHNYPFFLMTYFIFLSACTTISYKQIHQDEYRAEIQVASDRIVPRCEYVSEEKNTYMFGLEILDEVKTVTLTLETNGLDKESCEWRVTLVNKLISNGKKIYIAGMGNLIEERRKGEYNITFPQYGTFESNGRSIQLLFISNERGECFGAFTGTEKPCPTDGFPVVNKKMPPSN